MPRVRRPEAPTKRPEAPKDGPTNLIRLDHAARRDWPELPSQSCASSTDRELWGKPTPPWRLGDAQVAGERAQHPIRRFRLNARRTSQEYLIKTYVRGAVSPSGRRPRRLPTNSPCASATTRSRSFVACWYRKAAAAVACPARCMSSAVVAPVAAARVSPV